MKLGATIAALALVGAAAATASNPALADSKDPPHALTTAKAPSSFTSNAQAKPRSFTTESKAGTQSNMMPPPAVASDKK